jgi:hypothetical protein
MIAFDLCCSTGHSFEGWFEDSNSFEIQMHQGFISCPVCGDTDVRKILSPVAIRKKAASGAEYGGIEPLSIEQQIETLEKIGREIRTYIEKNFEDVGTDFAKEALKMHYGVSDPRGIRGVSSESDDDMLRKEGITFFKLPVIKEPDSDL